MIQEEKERVIKIAYEWLSFNLTDLPIKEQKFWIDDFVNYLDINLGHRKKKNYSLKTSVRGCHITYWQNVEQIMIFKTISQIQ